MRQRCGLFDVSHMGEIEVRGRGPPPVCQQLTVNDVARLARSAMRPVLDPLQRARRACIDDLIVYPPRGRSLSCSIVNARTTPADLAWIARAHRRPDVELVDRSAELGAARAAGARARRPRCERSRPSTVAALAAVHRYRDGRSPARPALGVAHGLHGRGRLRAVASTQRRAPRAVGGACSRPWRRAAGCPRGLGARDTLRLEAGAAAVRHATWTRDTTPLEAGLAWVVKLGKGDFIGRGAAGGAGDGRRRPAGSSAFELDERRRPAPRPGGLARRRRQSGTVTSGTQVADARHLHRARRTWRAARAQSGRRSPSTSADGACPARVVRASLLPPGASGAGAAMKFPDDAPLHEGARVAAPRGRARASSASPTSPRTRSATSCSSSCRRSARR